MREDLNRRAPRVMAVLRPLKVVLTNYPEGQVEEVDVINNPEDAAAGTRKVPFSRVLYIEQDDFTEDPPKKFFRLSPGKEVRLRCAYFITCTEVVKDERGEIVELRCTYDPATRGRRFAGRAAREGDTLQLGVGRSRGAGRRSAAVRSSVLGRRSERVPDGKTLLDQFNPDSLEIAARLAGSEPSLGAAQPGARGPVRAARLFLSSIPDSARRALSSSTAPCPCATAGRRFPKRGSRRGISHQPLDLGTGRARDSVHGGVLRRISRKKSAAEIVRRLSARAHLILLATAPPPDDPGTVVPVSFKVSARDPQCRDGTHEADRSANRLGAEVQFLGRRVLYSWIGGTCGGTGRGQGFFRALTEQQELWAIEQGFR